MVFLAAQYKNRKIKCQVSSWEQLFKEFGINLNYKDYVVKDSDGYEWQMTLETFKHVKPNGSFIITSNVKDIEYVKNRVKLSDNTVNEIICIAEKHDVQCIIPCSTRQVSLQLLDAFKKSNISVENGIFFSTSKKSIEGEKYDLIQRNGNNSKVIIGTFGRILDLYKNGSLKSCGKNVIVVYTKETSNILEKITFKEIIEVNDGYYMFDEEKMLETCLVQVEI
jgi:hypothetical protein